MHVLTSALLGQRRVNYHLPGLKISPRFSKNPYFHVIRQRMISQDTQCSPVASDYMQRHAFVLYTHTMYHILSLSLSLSVCISLSLSVTHTQYASNSFFYALKFSLQKYFVLLGKLSTKYLSTLFFMDVVNWITPLHYIQCICHI